MSHVHVCLVSDQPIPNLTTALQFRPDKVILLTTSDKKAEGKRLEGVLRKKGIDVDVRSIKPYDLNNVIEASERVINDYPDHNLSLNITGGTKIGTVGTFQAFYTAGKTIYYVDTFDNRILQISPTESSIPIQASIPVADYLKTYGFNIKAWSKDDQPLYRRRKATECLVEIAIREPKSIGSLNYSVPSLDNKVSFPIRFQAPSSPQIHELLSILAGNGYLEMTKGGTIRIDSSEIAEYLKGKWLEEYVYIVLKGLNVGEVKLNAEGTWEGQVKNPPKNEFDVLVANKNKLFLISCKTANPDRQVGEKDEAVAKEYLYELVSLGDRALGLFGKKALISARPITNSYVRDRANVMKVTIIDGRNIATLKENLKAWIS
ncbi:MAG TPA: hypothetical protein DCZ04_00230 [Syntrophorhabdus aromaticivorans]|nr:hypothetical protein [Syntrophorhabdus aromaticivorans]